MDFEQDIKACIAVLENGGTILYPTDTVWGLGCDATNMEAIEKIFAIKHRPKEKSVIVLAGDAMDILQYVATPPPDIVGLLEAFDQPTTVIYKNGINLAENAINEDGSLAIRVTSDAFCKALIKRFRKPIVSTSANLSGEKTPALFPDVSAEILAGVDYVVKYRQDDPAIKSPSSLVRILENGDLEKLR